MLEALFDRFMADPDLMPERWAQSARQDLGRSVTDYLAGMTDRYAEQTFSL